MRSLMQFIRAMAIFFLLLLAACGTSPLTSTPAPTATLAPIPSSTLAPTLLPTLTPTALPQAFFCVAPVTPTPAPGCSLPTGQERDRTCVRKVPYTLIAIPPDVTYQVISPNFFCADGGIRGGSRLLSCSGPQSFTFLVKVCRPGCVAAAPLQSGPKGYCTSGYNYDPANNCCQSAATDPNGCITLKFDTRSCGN